MALQREQRRARLVNAPPYQAKPSLMDQLKSSHQTLGIPKVMVRGNQLPIDKAYNELCATVMKCRGMLLAIQGNEKETMESIKRGIVDVINILEETGVE